MRRLLRVSRWTVLAAGFVLAVGSAMAEGPPIPFDLPKIGEEKNVAAPELAPELLAGDAANPQRIVTALKNLPKTQPDLAAAIGGHSSQLFRRLAPLVVLVVADDGSGSGSIISPDGYVITNNHVIQGSTVVAVILKPEIEGAEPTEADAWAADVVKVDQVADLALLKIRNWPQWSYVELGDANAVSIGDDVHAIGHPVGENWTYTKGVISQIRNSYKWSYESEFDHVADVIQTQTPINPGNSGGPLFDDDGRMIGVNSFGDGRAQGINFAISVREVRRFLDASASRYAETFAPPAEEEGACQPVVLFTGRSDTDDSEIRVTDEDCDDAPDVVEEWYDDKSIGYVVLFDDNGDGKWESIVVDVNADGSWDYSLYDTDGDGKADLRGVHAGGAWEPSEYKRV